MEFERQSCINMEKFSGEISGNDFHNMQDVANNFDPDNRIESNTRDAVQLEDNKYDPDERITTNKYSENTIDAEETDRPRYIITTNESLENDRHPFTGVPFERKIVTLPDGEKVEGVFPKFDSLFDAKISKELYLKTDAAQFRECNKQLAKAIENDSELKSKFSAEQISQIYDGIYDGTAPEGYVWHHNEEAGKLQLVDFTTHQRTGHTGGRCLWGGGSDKR